MIGAENLAELTRMADELAASGRQYDEWCARHGYRRNSFLPGAMDLMHEADHAEAIKEDRERSTEWWVYVRNGAQRAFPVGPFTSKPEADSWVQPTTRYVEEHVDAMAGFYEWGVAGIPKRTGRTGRFNAAVGVRA